MFNDFRQKADGSYKDLPRERNIRADAIKETFAAARVALTTSGRYVDLDNVQSASHAPRPL